jgi:hypothetical protein
MAWIYAPLRFNSRLRQMSRSLLSSGREAISRSPRIELFDGSSSSEVAPRLTVQPTKYDRRNGFQADEWRPVIRERKPNLYSQPTGITGGGPWKVARFFNAAATCGTGA